MVDVNLAPNRYRLEKFLYQLFENSTELMPKIGNKLRMYRETAPPEPSFPYFVYSMKIDDYGVEEFFLDGAMAISIYTMILNNRYGQNEAIQETIVNLLHGKFYRHAEGTKEEIQVQFYMNDDQAVPTDNINIERTDLIFTFKINSNYSPPTI